MKNSKALIIGIAGPSGAGKTTFAKSLQKKLGESILSVLALDNYFKDFSNLSFNERKQINFDHPDALDVDLLEAHLSVLKLGHSVKVPVYDFINHCRSNERLSFKAANIIIVEGTLLYHFSQVKSHIDFSIFLDTSLEVCINRRINRDMKERGRSRESIMNRFTNYVLPMNTKFVEPTKKNADIVISSSDISLDFDGILLNIQNNK